jgi:hypothetical protein
MIISQKWKITTQTLRTLRKEEQCGFKQRQLPFVTFSGIFYARHNQQLVRHSNLLCFDLDHVGSEPCVQQLQRQLIADPLLDVQLAFRSPSGNGLKLVIKMASLFDLRQSEVMRLEQIIEIHNAEYAKIAQHILHQHNIQVDKTNDVARACFLCHDPNAYIKRPSTVSTSKTLNPVYSVRDKHSIVHQPLTINLTLESAIQLLETHAIDITTQYHDWYRIGMALASHYGEVGRNYYHRISRFYPRYTIEETNKQYNLCLKYNNYRIKLGTIFYLINHQLHHITHKTPIKV